VTIYSLEDIRKIFILTNAHLKLSKLSIRFSGNLIPPSDILILLVQNGLFDDAFSVALHFQLDMSIIFSTLTKVIIQIQNPPYSKELLSEEWISSLPTNYGNLNITLWLTLKEYLEKYDKETHYKYHISVAEKILSMDRRAKLPLWLLDDFKRELNSDKGELTNASALIFIYLKYDLIDESLEIGSYIIENLLKYIEKNNTVELPYYISYNYIDQLIRRLEEISSTPNTINEDLKNRFNIALDTYRNAIIN